MTVSTTIQAENGPASPIAQRWLMRLRSCWQQPKRTGGFWQVFILATGLSLVFLIVPAGPPELGPDAGWCAVLGWAHEQGAQFGKEIVFTYGPLGYLLAPYCVKAPAGSLILANAVLCFAIASGVCLVARRLAPIWQWTLLAVFCFESANVDPRADLLIEVGLYCWGLLCVVEPGRRQRWCVLCFLLLAAFASLTKVTNLFLAVFSMVAIAGLAAASGQSRVAMIMPVGFAAALASAWMIAGQSFWNLGVFVRNGFLFSRGYGEAMGLEGLPMLRWQGFFLGGLALAAVMLRTWWAFEPNARRVSLQRLVLFCWLIGQLFLVWKHSMVRLDRFHIIELAVFTPVLLLALDALPYTSARLRHGTLALSVLGSITSLAMLQSAFLGSFANSWQQPFRQFVYHAGWLFAPEKNRQELGVALEEKRREAQLPKIQRLVGRDSVDVFGSLQAFALLNGLNYHPRPLFQSYAAYSPALAQLNAQYYLSDEAPEYVLYGTESVSHQFRTIEDELAFRTLWMNYKLVDAETPFLLLKRKGTTPATLSLLAEADARPSEKFDLRLFGETNLWVEIEYRPNLAGLLMKALYRQPVIRLSIWKETPMGEIRIGKRRVAGSVLHTGFAVSSLVANPEDLRSLWQGQPVPHPSALSVEPDPGNEGLWEKQMKYRVYRINEMPIKSESP